MAIATELDEKQSLNSPIKWVGGKSRLKKHIINLLPTDYTCYLELFSGAAWVLFGKQPSPVEIINDIDGDLVSFFRIVKEKPEELIASFEWDLVSRAEFDRLADLNPLELTELQRAHRFFYLIMAGWGGELNYPRFQTSITDGGGGNRLIGGLKTLRQRLEPVHARLRSVIIENLDWKTCLNRYDRAGAVAYIDPPYPQNKCNYAHNMRSWEEHEELAERLRQTKCRWIYSSYDTTEIRELFSGMRILSVESASGMNTEKNGKTRKTNKEVLITNFPVVPTESIVVSESSNQTLFDVEEQDL